MGVYELSNQRAPSGSAKFVNHNAGDDTKPKRYLYRADGSTHGGARKGLWIACDDEDMMEKNLGVIRSVQADAELPTAAGLKWIQAEGLVVTEVRSPCALTLQPDIFCPSTTNTSTSTGITAATTATICCRRCCRHHRATHPSLLFLFSGRRGRAGVDRS